MAAVTARLLSALLQAGTLVLLVRTVSTAEFGLYAVVLSLGAIASAVLGLGLQPRALRLPAAEAEHLRTPIATLAFLQSLVLFFGGLLIGMATQGWAVPQWLLAGLTYVATEYFTSVLQNLLFGEERHARATAALLLRRALPLVGLIGAPAFGLSSMNGFVIGVASTAVATWICLGQWRKPSLSFSAVVRSSHHYWKNNMWGMFQQLDVPIMGGFFGTGLTATYAAGFRLASPVHVITSIISSMSVPAITRAATPTLRRRSARRALRFAFGYASLVALAAPLTHFLGPLLLGDDFSETAWVFPILVLASALSVVNQIMSAVLFAYSKPALVARANLLTTALGICLMLVGGLSGIAVLTVSSTVLIQLMLLLILMTPLRAAIREAKE